ncbi:MAG: hypothetical protein WDZ88_00770 [Candidatus Paceibacterota bacterium]
MKKYLLFTLASIYIVVGLYLWQTGGGWNGPGLYENIFTFFYAVFLWPIMMGLFVLFN